MIPLCKCNPFIRNAMIQDYVIEGDHPRIAYDNRIFLILNGIGTVIISDKEFEIGSNSLIYIGIKDNYYFKGRFSAVVINFDMTMDFFDRKIPCPPTSREYYDESSVFDRTEAEGFTSPSVIYADEELKNDIIRLTDLFIKDGSNSDTLCSATLKKILADIVTAQNKSINEKTLLAQRILFYIRENATKIEDNTDVAKELGYHHIYLGEILKSQTGKTIHKVVIEEKLRVASRMLIYTNSSIEEIAEVSGFSSRSRFCTVFKSHFGTTPLSYRNMRAVRSI